MNEMRMKRMRGIDYMKIIELKIIIDPIKYVRMSLYS